MVLKDLIENLPIEPAQGGLEREINGIVTDSRKAGADTLFIAFPGGYEGAKDGHDYIEDAYERGCRAFLVNRPPGKIADRADAVFLLTESTRHSAALLSRRFFDTPENRLKLIGLTGTKGKTTISFMLKTIFEKAGKKIGLIGSNGVIYGDVCCHLPNTTPEAHVIHGILKDMADAGIEYCVLEATSQGFMLHRTDGIVFDAALFTNISPDHISKTEHESFEHYFACKKQIFGQTRLCFVNRDAELYDEIVKDVPPELIKLYGQEHNGDGSCYVVEGTQQEPSPLCRSPLCRSLDYAAKDIQVFHGSCPYEKFLCEAPGWKRELRVNIPGGHNVENALGAVCIADHYGIDPEHIAAGLLDSVSPEGRMERVEVPAPFTVFIDYAHNKLSMETMMSTVKLLDPKRILCVFGLDGDRAHIRRKDCGEILGRDADYTILSDTSPRTDDPEKILRDVAENIERVGGTEKCEIIHDRNLSIPKILGMADEGDVVLIVGTGDRLSMEVHGELTAINEREIINRYFSERREE